MTYMQLIHKLEGCNTGCNALAASAWGVVLTLKGGQANKYDFCKIQANKNVFLLACHPQRSHCLQDTRKQFKSLTSVWKPGMSRAHTFMMGSRSLTDPFLMPSLNAPLAAIWNASTLESTSWYEPSYRVAVTSTTGKPANDPADIISSVPCSTTKQDDGLVRALFGILKYVDFLEENHWFYIAILSTIPWGTSLGMW